MSTSETDRVLLDGLRAVSPYLDRLVIAGGWAPYIYSKIYKAEAHHNPLITRDIDMVIPNRGFADGLPSLDKTILAAGFRHEFASLDTPPVVKYVKDNGNENIVEIEFITDAPGFDEGTVRIGSVNAQSLHFVSLLLDDPWEVDFEEVGFNLPGKLLIPQPGSYVLHKTLSAGRRRLVEKTAKDLYYVFYVLEAFPEWKKALFERIISYKQARSTWTARAYKYLVPLFADIDSLGVDYLVSQRPQTAFTQITGRPAR